MYGAVCSFAGQKQAHWLAHPTSNIGAPSSDPPGDRREGILFVEVRLAVH